MGWREWDRWDWGYLVLVMWSLGLVLGGIVMGQFILTMLGIGILYALLPRPCPMVGGL